MSHLKLYILTKKWIFIGITNYNYNHIGFCEDMLLFEMPWIPTECLFHNFQFLYPKFNAFKLAAGNALNSNILDHNDKLYIPNLL